MVAGVGIGVSVRIGLGTSRHQSRTLDVLIPVRDCPRECGYVSRRCNTWLVKAVNDDMVILPVRDLLPVAIQRVAMADERAIVTRELVQECLSGLIRGSSHREFPFLGARRGSCRASLP